MNDGFDRPGGFDDLRPPEVPPPPAHAYRASVERGSRLRRRRHTMWAAGSLLAASGAAGVIVAALPHGELGGQVRIVPATQSPSCPGTGCAPTATPTSTTTGTPTPTGHRASPTTTPPAPPPPSAAVPTTSPTSVPPSVLPSTGAATTGAATGAASASSPATTHCQTRQLTVELGNGRDAGMSQSAQSIVLRNRSGVTCTVQGYPGVLLLAKDGSTVAEGKRGGGYFAPAPDDGARSIPLAPGAAASFDLEFVNIDPGSIAVTALQIIPPDERQPLTFPFTTAYPKGSELRITYLVPGTDGGLHGS